MAQFIAMGGQSGQDPLLAPHFVWDASRLSKLTEKSLYILFMNHGLRNVIGMYRYVVGVSLMHDSDLIIV